MTAPMWPHDMVFFFRICGIVQLLLSPFTLVGFVFGVMTWNTASKRQRIVFVALYGFAIISILFALTAHGKEIK